MDSQYQYIMLIIVLTTIIYMWHKQTEFFNDIPTDYIDLNLKIFIINLADRQTKKDYMIEQMKKYNLKYNMFEAINGLTLNVDNLVDSNVVDHAKSIKYMKRLLRRGEIGCALSHIFIWNKIIQESGNEKFYLIFEDDAILSNNFKSKLENILKDVENKDWDVLYLNDNCYSHFGDQCDGDDFSDTTIKPFRSGYGLYGYVIKKNFAEKCINNLHKDTIPSIFPIYMPIDDYLDYKSQSGSLTCIRSKEIIVEVNRKFDSDTTKIK